MDLTPPVLESSQENTRVLRSGTSKPGSQASQKTGTLKESGATKLPQNSQHAQVQPSSYSSQPGMSSPSRTRTDNEHSGRQAAGNDSKGKIKTVYHWYCCVCGYGPNDVNYYNECVNPTCRSSHLRCRDCPVEKVRVSTRY